MSTSYNLNKPMLTKTHMLHTRLIFGEKRFEVRFSAQPNHDIARNQAIPNIELQPVHMSQSNELDQVQRVREAPPKILHRAVPQREGCPGNPADIIQGGP